MFQYRFLIVIVLVAAVVIYFFGGNKSEEVRPRDVSRPVYSARVNPSEKTETKKEILSPPTAFSELKSETIPRKALEVLPSSPQKKESTPQALHYRLDEDGLVMVDEDIILGELKPGSPAEGLVSPPELQLWPGGHIPYHIQPDVENPERILEALALFEGTPITFTPFNDEKDAIVFQNYGKDCKSYLGRIGGHQPIFISRNCEAPEIAHEIMHALGFIHEQNRTDRDQYVRIAWDNVIESSKINFELFPASLMRASGGVAFDFESLMMYPPNAFSKNGQDTIQTAPGNRILPSRRLSPKDRQRLQEVYGR